MATERKFQIVTDSGCDMPQSFFEVNGIECIKFGFAMDNTEYCGEDGTEIEEKEFYDKLRGGAMPTTYQITAAVATAHIEKFLQDGHDVLIIAFSSGLSGTVDGFNFAVKELSKLYPERKICVVDSLCASMGQGLLLHYVIEKANEGTSIEETTKYAEGLRLKIAHQFTVDSLFHLKRGGRISLSSAIVGSMIKIKPTLHMDDNGKLKTTGKAIGRKKALRKIVDNMIATNDLKAGDPIYISHADCMEDVQYLKKLLLEKFSGNEIYVNYIGPVIGCHAGCGTIAIFFKAKQR